MAAQVTDFLKLSKAELKEFRDRYDAYIFDMDGCLSVVGSGYPVERAPETLAELVRNRKAVKVLTDNCHSTLESISSRIIKNFPAIKREDVMSTGYLLGKYLKHINFAKKVYVIGEENGAIKELKSMNFEVVHDEEIRKRTLVDLLICELEKGVGAVVVSADMNFDATKIKKAVNYLLDPEVLLLQTHYPNCASMNPIVPAVGSFIAAIKAASGRTETICSGKGSKISVKYLQSLGYEMERCLMVGDGLSNDIHTGNLCGMDTLLVLSGTDTLEDVEKASSTGQVTYLPKYSTNSVADLLRLFE